MPDQHMPGVTCNLGGFHKVDRREIVFVNDSGKALGKAKGIKELSPKNALLG